MSAEDKKYLSSHDLPMVVERMTCMLIADKPADPLGAMVQWLESQRRPTTRPSTNLGYTACNMRHTSSRIALYYALLYCTFCVCFGSMGLWCVPGE